MKRLFWYKSNLPMV